MTYTCTMNEVRNLYTAEPQYIWNTVTENNMNTIKILPCGLPVQNEIHTDITLLDTFSKGRIWYGFGSEVFIDTPWQSVYNELFFNAVKEKDFSLSLLTTSKVIMKYINVLQTIREVEIGVWFSSDEAKNDVFTQRLDILRRLYLTDFYTIVYLNTEGNIADVINLAELVSGLCHTAYLYGNQIQVVSQVKEIFEEHKKTVFYVAENNNALFL